MTERDLMDPSDPRYNRSMAEALNVLHIAYDNGTIDPATEAEYDRDAPTWRSDDSRLAVGIQLMLPVAPVDEAPRP